MYAGKPNAFPVLKGKGAEIRHLALPLLVACGDFLDDAVEQHKWMKLLLKMAIDMETLLDFHRDEYRFPEQAANDFKKAAYGFVQLNTIVGHHFHDRRQLLFNFTIKFHYVLHLGHIAAYINPRLAWCYSGEDFMHKVKAIVQASDAGSPPWLVPLKTMRKSAQGLGMSFLDHVWKRD